MPLLAGIVALAEASAAPAGCFADYKAKQETPLRLHYGVIALPNAACTGREAAAREVDRRLAPAGWQLLTLMSVFGADGLEQRKAAAGRFFLKY